MEQILLWLAQGAVQYAGAEVLAGIVGDSRLKNIDKIVRDAVAQIQALTKRAIEENEIRKLSASLDSVLRNLNHYSLLKTRKAKEANIFLLTEAITLTSDAVSQCASLGTPALLCYGNAVSFHLIARIAHYKLTGTSEARKMVEAMAEEAKHYVEASLPPFIASLEPAKRVTWDKQPCNGSVNEFMQWSGRCYAYVDGNRVEVFSGIGDTERGVSWEYFAEMVAPYIAEAERSRTEAINHIEKPLREAIIKWKEAATSRKLLPYSQTGELAEE